MLLMDVQDQTERTKAKVHLSPPKKPRRNYRKRLLRQLSGFCALIIMASVCISGVYAADEHKLTQTNKFTSDTVDNEIQEPTVDTTEWDQGDTRTKQVQFKNTGSSPVFLRVAYTETMTAGTEWLPMLSTDVTKNWTAAWTSDWVDGGDGWYYYKKVLLPNTSTDQILSSITMNVSPKSDAGFVKTYELDFLTETVQASNEAAVNTKATQTVFGKTGTISGMTVDAHNSVTGGTVGWS